MRLLATSQRARRALACAPVLLTLAALPAAALAREARSGGGGGGGGGGLGVSGGGGSTTTSSPATPVAADVIRLAGVVNATGDGITLTVAASGTQGQPLTIRGAAPGSDAGAVIDVEASAPGHTNWTQVSSALIAPNGSFAARWTPTASAQVALRAVLAPAPSSSTSGGGGLTTDSAASAAAGELATSALTIPIFRAARATMYGPGFWGHRTACGERLRHATLGVASRTLKCGTPVAIYYDGNEITVPVIDRGPFTKGVNWDLTMATAEALGMVQTSVIGALDPAPAPAPVPGA